MNLAQIRTLARQKADEESANYISNSETLSYINEALRYVYGKIAQRFENYFVARGSVGNGGLISVVAGTDQYALPSSLQKIVRVEQRNSGNSSENDWIVMPNLNIANDNIRGFYPPREGWGRGPAFGYFIAGNYLYIRPVPTSSFSLRLWFVPKVTALVLDADEPGIPEEYHEMLSEYAAAQMLAKSGEGLFQERTKAFQTQLEYVLETAEMRNQNPEQMVVTESGDYDIIGFGPV